MNVPSSDPRAADSEARAAALDVRRSWLVQAPAGSGKTELLVQRVLALLAHVDEPERVVATTFTVKAAAEMRGRVVAALQDARDGVAADTPHRATTLRLAAAALARDSERDWHLLDFPARLDIGTLDALARRIAAQLPVASALGGMPRPVENPEPLYRIAVQRSIASAAADDAAWRTLFGHYDNDGARVTGLLVAMLARRDQWMAPLLSLRDSEVREALERTMSEEIARELDDIAAMWPAPLVDELVTVARHAQDMLESVAAAASAGTPSITLAMLREVAARRGLPEAHAGALTHWRSLAGWLLTKEGEFRKRVSEGIAPIGSGTGAGARRELNQRVSAWLEACAASVGLDRSLHRVRLLPDPVYSPRASAFIDALATVLPRVAAELVVVFGVHGACDFGEVTLRALQALGDADDPGDVLLAQDMRIQHLLIDEFQDTSSRQLDLVKCLAAGWQPGDGRTLFVVGDPMQSIYAFRQAEVRNFLDAARAGKLGGVPIGKLVLARNFRAQANLVEHVNALFPGVLGRVATRTSTAVDFAPSIAARDATLEMPTFEWAEQADDEAARVVAHVKRAIDDGLRDVAILVRARPHVEALLPALRAAKIPYSAVQLESLAEHPLSRDLLCLARAMTQPADRLAWLSLLRAPFVGMRLPDLLEVALHDRAVPGISIHDSEIRGALSTDGAARLGRVAGVLARIANVPQLPLANRVRSAWMALDGPASYAADASNALAADAMLTLIAAHDRGGDIDDFDALADEAATLKADANSNGEGDGDVATAEQPPARAPVRVMTVHAAKGLEFDVVVLPGLARATRGADSTMLRWRARVPDRALMIATPAARDDADDDPIDRWLKSLDQDDAAAEVARLLYVGFTRARRRLHLVAVGRVTGDAASGNLRWAAPHKGSLLAMLWPEVAVSGAPPRHPAAPAAESAPSFAARAAPLARLPLDYRAPLPGDDVVARAEIAIAQSRPRYDWADASSAAIGTVVHRVLAGLESHDDFGADAVKVVSMRPRIEAELASLGVLPDARDDAVARACEAVTATLGDPAGRWLFDPTHGDVAREWALTAVVGGDVRRIVIDRSFVADGVRWIVDFKTSRHEGGDLDAFVARERERHTPQLESYAAVLAAMESRPIRLALYFPALSRRVDWAWER